MIQCQLGRPAPPPEPDTAATSQQALGDQVNTCPPDATVAPTAAGESMLAMSSSTPVALALPTPPIPPPIQPSSPHAPPPPVAAPGHLLSRPPADSGVQMRGNELPAEWARTAPVTGQPPLGYSGSVVPAQGMAGGYALSAAARAGVSSQQPPELQPARAAALERATSWGLGGGEQTVSGGVEEEVMEANLVNGGGRPLNGTRMMTNQVTTWHGDVSETSPVVAPPPLQPPVSAVMPPHHAGVPGATGAVPALSANLNPFPTHPGDHSRGPERAEVPQQWSQPASSEVVRRAEASSVPVDGDAGASTIPVGTDSAVTPAGPLKKAAAVADGAHGTGWGARAPFPGDVSGAAKTVAAAPAAGDAKAWGAGSFSDVDKRYSLALSAQERELQEVLEASKHMEVASPPGTTSDEERELVAVLEASRLAEVARQQLEMDARAAMDVRICVARTYGQKCRGRFVLTAVPLLRVFVALL